MRINWLGALVASTLTGLAITSVAVPQSAHAQGTLRVGMTANDIPACVGSTGQRL